MKWKSLPEASPHDPSVKYTRLAIRRAKGKPFEWFDVPGGLDLTLATQNRSDLMTNVALLEICALRIPGVQPSTEYMVWINADGAHEHEGITPAMQLNAALAALNEESAVRDALDETAIE